jgi:hypothetical protein
MSAGLTQPQYITLQAWAEARYPNNVPHPNTLRRWAQNGTIQPRPFKRGNVYMVTPDARHSSEPAPASRLVDRLRNGLAPA